MEENEGQWVSIIEYASIRKISISTVRRYIKADRVRNKLDNGKYMIFLPSNSTSLMKKNELHQLKAENEQLKSQIRTLKEENNDLKMLVNLYENNQMGSNLANESI